MQNYVKFRAKEWAETYNRASRKFIKDVLGTKPTFESVKKDIANPHQISPLEWAMIPVLLVVAAFTSYKLGALAVPFAHNAMATLTQHTYIAQWVQDSFTAITAAMFMLMGTFSLIYFKLLDKEPEVTVEKAESRITSKRELTKLVDLNWVTPRLPYVLVYLSLAWLFYTSSQIPGTPFEQYLPVVVEIGLAALVGNILRKRQEFNHLVYARLAELVKPYEAAKADHATDPRFLRVLYQVMREDMAQLKRTDLATRKTVQPNLWMENAQAEDVDAAIVAEYHRNTGGLKFAATVNVPEVDVPVQVAAVANRKVNVATTNRKPPFNKAEWTVEDLVHDLRASGAKSGYSEGELLATYAKGYGARTAWRNGAREAFEKATS